jgi:succinate dehydrogenase / fumarate reductase flavoprotein subunit
MQGLADGYFVLPYTIQNYLAYEIGTPRSNPKEVKEFKEAEESVKSYLNKLMGIKGKTSVDTFHKRLGHVMWNNVGMARTEEGLKEAIAEIQQIKKDFWSDLKITGEINAMNVELEKANRVADFIEIGELMARDALNRNESCGGHFRLEYQTDEGEAMRRDDKFMYVAAWEYKGDDQEPELHKEELKYEGIEVKTRNYKSA